MSDYTKTVHWLKYLSHNNKKILVFYPGISDIFWYCFWIHHTCLRGAGLVRDHIFTSIANEEKSLNYCWTAKYYFDFHSLNIKFRSSENKNTFLDVFPVCVWDRVNILIFLYLLLLCFGFSMRTTLKTHWYFRYC